MEKEYGLFVYTIMIYLMQWSLCCSLPGFRVLLWTHYGPLQWFSTCFRRPKEFGVLGPIFPDYVISCDYGENEDRFYRFYGSVQDLQIVGIFSNKVSGPRPATLLKKRLRKRRFSVSFVIFLSLLFLFIHNFLLF